MSYRFIIYFLLFAGLLSGQENCDFKTLVVDYEIILNDTVDIESFQRAWNQTLVTDGKKSHQTLYSHIDTTLYSKYGGAHIFTSDIINKSNYYKVIFEKQINYGMKYGFYETNLITDEYLFVNYREGDQWKEIQGYKCKQLFTSFRGRDYELYYAPELKDYQDGPWKFMAAPGLILEVRSLDNAVNMKATSLQYSTVLPVKNMPDHWRSSIGITFEEFVKLYNKWRKEVAKKNKFEDPNIIVTVPYRDFEIYKPYFVDNHQR